MKYTNELVAKKLKEYPLLKKNLRLLSFEMEHIMHVTDEDVLQVMAQAVSCWGGVGLGNNDDADKIMSIALSYRERAAILNDEAFSAIFLEMETIYQELARVDFYLNILAESEKNILVLCYFEKLSWQALEEKLGLSRRTIIRRRDKALGHLAELWNYSTSFIDK